MTPPDTNSIATPDYDPEGGYVPVSAYRRPPETTRHVLEAIRHALDLGADDRTKVVLIERLMEAVPITDPAHEPIRLLRDAAHDAGAKWLVT